MHNERLLIAPAGVSKPDTLLAGETAHWTYNGQANENITLSVEANIRPRLRVVGPSGNVIAQADAITRPQFTLPADGKYIIDVSTLDSKGTSTHLFATDGTYKLSLQSSAKVTPTAD